MSRPCRALGGAQRVPVGLAVGTMVNGSRLDGSREALMRRLSDNGRGEGKQWRLGFDKMVMKTRLESTTTTSPTYIVQRHQ